MFNLINKLPSNLRNIASRISRVFFSLLLVMLISSIVFNFIDIACYFLKLDCAEAIIENNLIASYYYRFNPNILWVIYGWKYIFFNLAAWFVFNILIEFKVV